MNKDWRERLAQYDDEKLDPRERAALDLLLDNDLQARATLAALRHDRQRFRQAFEDYAARRDPARSRALTAAVMARVAQERPRRASWLSRLPLPRLLEVCAAALMVFVVGLVARSNHPSLGEQACRGNLKGLSVAVLQYAQDYDETLPSSQHWVQQLEDHTGRALQTQCPEDRRPLLDARQVSYGMPLSLSGVQLGRAELASQAVRNSQVFLSDSDGSFLAPRHGQAANASFLDGHVAQVRPVTAQAGWLTP